MLRVVHGGVTAGRVDSHSSLLALMIAPRLWYRKPRPASSGGTAVRVAASSVELPMPTAAAAEVHGVACDRLLSIGRACFNGARAIGHRRRAANYYRHRRKPWISA